MFSCISFHRAALSDLASHIHDRSSRWKRIEALTGLEIIHPANSNYPKPRESILRQNTSEFDDRASVSCGISMGSVTVPSLPVTVRARRPGPSVIARRISDEILADIVAPFVEESPREFIRKDSNQVLSGVNKENGVKLGESAMDSDCDSPSRPKLRVNRKERDGYDFNDSSSRKAPDIRVDAEFRQTSYESDNTGRNSPPTGPIDSDHEKPREKKVSGLKKVMSNLSLAMHHKK